MFTYASLYPPKKNVKSLKSGFKWISPKHLFIVSPPLGRHLLRLRRCLDSHQSPEPSSSPSAQSSPFREAPPKKTVYIWALPKLQFDPPYCANPGTLWHEYFAKNEKIL